MEQIPKVSLSCSEGIRSRQQFEVVFWDRVVVRRCSMVFGSCSRLCNGQPEKFQRAISKVTGRLHKKEKEEIFSKVLKRANSQIYIYIFMQTECTENGSEVAHLQV